MVASGGVIADEAVAAACWPDDPHALSRLWRQEARARPPERAWEACVSSDIAVEVLGQPGYPPVLAVDPEAPGVLFCRGDLGALSGPRVAIVGTRRCTSYGRGVARALGAELAAAGVRVISGLALGVDGAAHEGVLAAAAAPPVGVVGSGLDTVYPRRHGHLWRAVADQGLLLAEAPPGAAPAAWRFPARNRIMAALAQVVVVVESHAQGGSRHTVDAAMERGVTVMAVPGSVRSAASVGTNELLATGVPPARDAADVLVALELAVPTPRHSASRVPSPVAQPEARAARVLEAIGWEPASIDQVVVRTALPPAAVAVDLARLECDGWVTRRQGWWERLR